jgi:serine O-acetyltransferase
VFDKHNCQCYNGFSKSSNRDEERLFKMFETLYMDVRRLYPECRTLRGLVKAGLHPRIQPIILYRATQWFYKRRMHRTARLLAFLNLILYRVEIALASEIGGGLFLPHGGVIIGAKSVGENATIYQNVTIGHLTGDPYVFTSEERPVLGDNVTLYAGCVVAGPIRVGDGVKIGANAVVTRSLEPGTTALPPQPTVAHEFDDERTSEEKLRETQSASSH